MLHYSKDCSSKFRSKHSTVLFFISMKWSNFSYHILNIQNCGFIIENQIGFQLDCLGKIFTAKHNSSMFLKDMP